MKKYILISIVGLLSIACKGQENDDKKAEKIENQTTLSEKPKGSWKVDKQFDEYGNLIRYDSIYSWSSNNNYNDLSLTDKDSLLQSFKSKFFTNFSVFENEGFENIFSQDSLFSEHFFNDDFFEGSFGKDFMEIDKLRQQMMTRQKKFLEKYQSEFIKPEDEN